MRLTKHVFLIVLSFFLGLGATAAMADVVVVVQAKNSVTTLSNSQIANMFLGKTSRFPDGSLAVPVDQREGSATRDEFYTKYAGKSPAQLKAHWSKIIFTGRGKPPKEVLNGADMKKRIVENPGAIGYIEHSQVDGSVKVLLGH